VLVYSVFAPRFEIDISHMQSRNVSHFVIVLDETRGLDVEVMNGECINWIEVPLYLSWKNTSDISSVESRSSVSMETVLHKNCIYFGNFVVVVGFDILFMRYLIISCFVCSHFPLPSWLNTSMQLGNQPNIYTHTICYLVAASICPLGKKEKLI